MLALSAVIAAGLPAPSFAQVPGTVKGGTKAAQDGTKAIGEISKVLAKFKDENGAQKFAQLAKITERIGDVAPFIAILTVAFDIAGLGAEKPEAKLLMGIKDIDAKLSALDARMALLFDNAVSRVNVEVKWSEIRDAVTAIRTKQQEIDRFARMTTDLDYPEYEKDDLSTILYDAANGLNMLCQTGDFKVAGGGKSLRTDVIESVAEGSYGNLDDIAAMGVYLTNQILNAKSAYKQLFFTAEYGRWQKGMSDFSSAAAIEAKSWEHVADFDALASACSTRTAEVMLQYGETTKQHKMVEDYLTAINGWSKTPKEIVDDLAGKYAYLDWYALKYNPVYGYANHLISYQPGTYFRPRTEKMTYNLVVGFSKKAQNFRPDLWQNGCGAIARDMQYQSDFLNQAAVAVGNTFPVFDGYFYSGARIGEKQTAIGWENQFLPSTLERADAFLKRECGDGRTNIDAFWIGRNGNIGDVELVESSPGQAAALKGIVFTKGKEYSHLAVLRDSDHYLDWDDYIKRKSQYFVQSVGNKLYLGASQDEDVLISSNAPTWMLVPADKGYFYLRSTVTGKYAGVDHPAFTTLIGAFYIDDFDRYAASYGAEKAHHFQWHFERQPGADPVFKISNRARPGQYLSTQRPYLTLAPAMGDVGDLHTNWLLQ